MKYLLVALLSCLMLTGCTPARQSDYPSQTQPTVLSVFAASSLSEPLTDIATQYQHLHPEVELQFTFDSSGTLKTQLEQGAVCDLFISACSSVMDALSPSQDTPDSSTGTGLIDQNSRVDLLKNKLVLAVAPGNPGNVQRFTDLTSEQVTSIAIGNMDVPAGQYAMQVFDALGITETLESQQKLTYGSSVTEISNQIAMGAVDCGIVYITDAATVPLHVVETAQSDWHDPIVYPGAVTTSSQHPQQAQDFLDFLQSSPIAHEIFINVGFQPLT